MTAMIDSIERAMDILNVFLTGNMEMSVTEIGKSLGLHKSTVFRTLETLESKGFVQQNPDNSKYRLGLQIYLLGMKFRENEPITKIIYPYAKALSDKFNEVVNIHALFHEQSEYPLLVMLEKIQSPQVLNLSPAIGFVGPCHCSASGKCLLAFSPAEYIKRFKGKPLPGFTKHTITDWDALLEDLAIIRKQGYSVDLEEREVGLTCIAAPIFNRQKKLVATISVAGPLARIHGERTKEIIEEVKRTAHQISTVLP